MARVLVVGGAGYVGSSTCAKLKDLGHEVWVLDDLSTGSIDLLLTDHFIYGQAGDSVLLENLFQQTSFDCVFHFAARSLVGESVARPQEYFENNVEQTQRLLEKMLKAGIQRFVFSSSCAVFGDPGELDLHEELPKKPLNPYGQTKLDVENHLLELANSHGLKSIALRYFNAAGAEPQLRVGECHDPETHLIPRIIKAALRNEPIEIYGTQYPTPDGTCIRDYIHVWDLAQAHLTALELLLRMNWRMSSGKGYFEAFNLGSEKGFSVREVIYACQEVIGHPLNVIEKGPRAGDPPRLVADSKKAQKELRFLPQFTNLKTLVSSAWKWEKKFSQRKRRAVFLDRDGTLNEDPGYLKDPHLLKLLPHVGEALRLLQRAGYLLVVVSNQSGVGRGLIPQDAISEVHKKMDQLLEPYGVRIDHYELCFHHPDEECECRKPKPKLLKDAALQHQIDLSRSFMIGDKESDLQAGQAAGCQAALLVKTGAGQATADQLGPGLADFIGDTLLDSVYWILSQGISNSLKAADQNQGYDK